MFLRQLLPQLNKQSRGTSKLISHYGQPSSSLVNYLRSSEKKIVKVNGGIFNKKIVSERERENKKEGGKKS